MNRRSLLNSVSFATEQLLGMTVEKNVNECPCQLANDANVSRVYVLENRQTVSISTSVPLYTNVRLRRPSSANNIRRVNASGPVRCRITRTHSRRTKPCSFGRIDLPEDERKALWAWVFVRYRSSNICCRWTVVGMLGSGPVLDRRFMVGVGGCAFKATAHVLGALLAHGKCRAAYFGQFTGNMLRAVFWIASP